MESPSSTPETSEFSGTFPDPPRAVQPRRTQSVAVRRRKWAARLHAEAAAEREALREYAGGSGRSYPEHVETYLLAMGGEEQKE